MWLPPAMCTAARCPFICVRTTPSRMHGHLDSFVWKVTVESMQRMSYDIKTGSWTEDRVDIKLERKHLGQGGLKDVQRAFRRAEGSVADDGGKTGATESGIRAVHLP